MNLKTLNWKFNFINKQIENSSSRLTEIDSSSIMKHAHLVNRNLVVVAMSQKLIYSSIDERSSSREYIDEIILFEDILI